MADQPLIPLRFQRSEIETKAELTPEAIALMSRNPHPGALIAALADAGLARDAVHALALMLPHRQVVWWACLAVRALPDLDRRPAELAAVVAAERWVQNPQAAEAEAAGDLADAVNSRRAAFWVATAAAWTGPSLAPRGQVAVPPAPYLPGLATRTALILLLIEPALEGKVGYPDWLVLGRALMHGDTGQAALTALRQRLAEG